MTTMFASSFPVAPLLLVETIYETKLLGQEEWHTFFLVIFGCSLNHVSLTLFPSDQLFDQSRIRNCSPIDNFSTICFRDHHNIFVARILHLVFLIDNGQNCSNSIDILWPHLLYNPPFNNVVSIGDSINYICKCYSGIWHLYLVYLCLFCMEISKISTNKCLFIILYYSPIMSLILLCS